jgi:hypothetical protein
VDFHLVQARREITVDLDDLEASDLVEEPVGQHTLARTDFHYEIVFF